MRKILIAMMFAGAALTGVGHAADKQLTPQQQKMKDCNAEAKAKEMKGQERKDFMKTCLSGKAKSDAAATGAVETPAVAVDAAAGSKKSAQKEKMKSCNAEAKEQGLKGQERKDFMKTCLSG